MEPQGGSPLASWSAPECRFTVEYAAGVLDDIRLAVVDAFFSLPRGGAEIGGLLLGEFGGSVVRINGYAAIDCEHATGPSFTLSDKDRARFAEQVAGAWANPPDQQPVGWYHSHTRSEIFLSEADQAVHREFFPEPWQTALVLRPHTFQPTRAGFFFREPDGTFRGERSYCEIALQPLPVQQIPTGPAPAGEPPEGRVREPLAASGGPVITVTASPVAEAPREEPRVGEPPPASPPPAGALPEPVPPPRFLEIREPPSRRRFWLLGTAVLAMAGVAAAYQTRGFWMPRAAVLFAGGSRPQPLSLGLNAIDFAGQLQIRWDRNSPAARNGVSGALRIEDGPAPQVIPLDAAHLKAGVFTYARQAEKVDIALTVRQPDGREAREATSFLGRLPAQLPFSESPEARKQREDIAKEAAKLKSDLNAQTERTRKLERSLDEVKAQMRKQQRERLRNQDPPR